MMAILTILETAGGLAASATGGAGAGGAGAGAAGAVWAAGAGRSLGGDCACALPQHDANITSVPVSLLAGPRPLHVLALAT